MLPELSGQPGKQQGKGGHELWPRLSGFSPSWPPSFLLVGLSFIGS